MKQQALIKKDLSISILLDVYGSVLSDLCRDSLYEYINNDLSLAEIACNAGLTKQAIHYQCRRAIARLKKYERILGTVAKLDMLKTKLSAQDFEIVRDVLVNKH